jgi:hypothetical protein
MSWWVKPLLRGLYLELVEVQLVSGLVRRLAFFSWRRRRALARLLALGLAVTQLGPPLLHPAADSSPPPSVAVEARPEDTLPPLPSSGFLYHVPALGVIRLDSPLPEWELEADRREEGDPAGARGVLGLNESASEALPLLRCGPWWAGPSAGRCRTPARRGAPLPPTPPSRPPASSW